LAAQVFGHYYAAAFEDLMVGPGGVAVKREVALEAGGFAENVRVAEDIDFWLRLGTSPGFVLVRQPALYAYRVESGPSLTGDTEELKKGVIQLAYHEINKRYPGKNTWRRARQHLLGRTLRPAMLRLACGQKEDRKVAWDLYTYSFVWNWQLQRWRFLLAFPLKLLAGWWRGK